MKCKKFIFFSFLILLYLPTLFTSSSIQSFTQIDELNEGESVFYLFNLNQTQTLNVSLERQSYGNFTLFLFNQRPNNDYVNFDKTLDLEIFDSPSLVSSNLTTNPSILYVANETKIYYLQVILVNNGTDVFQLYSNIELSKYYLPQIPGFQIENIMLICSMVIVFLIGVNKTKFSNHKNNP